MKKKAIVFLTLLAPFFSFSQEAIDVLILNKQYNKALQLIDQQIIAEPQASNYLKKALVLKKQMLYPEAMLQVDAALQLDPQNSEIWIERASISESLGDYDAAIRNYKTATQLRPNDLLIQCDLGQTYMRINEYSDALTVFEAIHSQDSLNLMFNKYYALAAYKAEKFKTAAQLYEAYLPQNPNDLSAYINLSGSYAAMNRKTKCLEILNEAYTRFPNNRTLHMKLANTLFVNKEYAEAERFYKTYFEKYDTTAQAYMNYGICHYFNKKEEKAIEILEACYQQNPNHPFINFYLGVSHKKLANYDLAAKYVDFSIFATIPEFHPEMYHHLGQIYGSMREFEKSIEALKKAYELDNRKVEVLFEIATTYEEFNFNKTMALNYYRTYLLEAGENANNANYAHDRMKKIKEELFFKE